MSKDKKPGFFARLGWAMKILFDGAFAARVAENLEKPPGEKVKLAEPPPEKTHASGLFVLGTLQQEGRLIDFLRQDVADFSDEEVGAAARVVHGGCRKALDRLVTLERVAKEDEGQQTAVPAGFDANRIRLTGNVGGRPPYQGTLRHHGWIATELRFPVLSASVDYRVLAPAEVEL